MQQVKQTLTYKFHFLFLEDVLLQYFKPLTTEVTDNFNMVASKRRAKKETARRPVIKKARLGFKPSTKKKIKKLCLVSLLFIIAIVLYDIFANEINQRSEKLVSDTWQTVSEKVAQTKQKIVAHIPQQEETQPQQEMDIEEGFNAATISKNTPYFDRPSTFAKPLGFLPKGTELVMSESKNNWVKIEGDGVWIRRSDLTIEEQF